jgi:hypothetical protein
VCTDHSNTCGGNNANYRIIDHVEEVGGIRPAQCFVFFANRTW